MENIMELDELKTAWQKLGRQLERNEEVNLKLLADRKLTRARTGLRPLFWGQLLQAALGVFLIVLGVACWTRNIHVPGLLVSGIIVHAFGVANVALAGLTMGLIATVDYSAPVLRIQKQMARLLRFYNFNSNVCGGPWWIMWVLVVVAFAGLGSYPPDAATPLWIWISLGIGIAGLLGTWFYLRRTSRLARSENGKPRCDGSDGIRRSQRILDEIAQFERE